MKTTTAKIRVVLIVIMLLILQCVMVGCSIFFRQNENDVVSRPSENYIEIINSNVQYDFEYDSFRLYVKIRNNYNGTIETYFSVNWYSNGVVYDSTFSDIITLAAGDVGYLSSISLQTIYYANNYSYRITGWDVYSW